MVMFAKRYEDPPEVWGVSRIVVDGDITPWPVAQRDIDDEAESLAPRLAALGLEPGGMVLVVAMLSQAVHAVPFEQAAGKLGALYSSADATPFDAFRVAALARQLEPQVIVGITGSVLDGLVDAGREPAEVFGPVRAVVAADDDAHARLRAVGLAPRRSVQLGPTTAIEGLDTYGPVYDATRWDVEEDDGELLVSNLVPRLTEARRLRTGVRGRVVGDGRVSVFGSG
ncbi:MAG TPA: hypothetical protein VGR04_07020 [Acidimicrobiia bacterium]|jgi:hypothetical protein|nr:hypothetical protein [Acidimicrobiia bacterium]